MPLTLAPTAEKLSLPLRLRRLLSRFRRVVILRGGSQTALFLVLAVTLVALLDWRYHLPALVRALALVGVLAGTALLAIGRIILPLRREGDILAMAIRVEQRHPELNDALLSAIQFLELPEAQQFGSRELREETIEHATAEANEIDFDDAAPSRGLRRSLLALLLALGGGGWIAGNAMEPARIALTRLFVPFGSTPWPAKTAIEIVAPQPLPHRMARGDALDLQVKLRGVIPERAKLGIWLDGASAAEQAYPVPKSEETPAESTLSIRVEPNRIPRNFRFRLRAGDADSGWQEVAVLPPPVLVPRDGRPSPQVHVDPPAYTGLPPVDLPDGGSVIEVVTGARVHIAAAADRPLVQASMAYRPEQGGLPLAAFLASLGGQSALATTASLQLSQPAWGKIPVELSTDGRLIDIEFAPWLPGPYRLRIEDATGLAAQRYFDVRVQTDPAPVVDIAHPSAGKESLPLLSDAEFTLAGFAHDKIFGLDRVFLEYRTSRTDAYCVIGFYDSAFVENVVPPLSRFISLPLTLPPPPLPTLSQYAVARRLSVRQFTHADGSALKDGDLLLLRVGATDRDRVTFGKQPGYSPEIELPIVSKPHLEALLQQQLTQMRHDLLLLHELQREARTKVLEVLKQLQQSNQLQRADLDRLSQAEALQQQIQARIGAAEEGLLAQTARMKQNIADNHLPHSTTTQRIEAVAADLQRLNDEELGPVEPLLGSVRKDQPKGTTGAVKAPLARAERHQREVEETLRSLLERLEPWSGAGEIRGEGRSILSELRKQLDLLGQLRKGQMPGVAGSKRDDLPQPARDELDRASIRPERQADRIRQLLEKVERLADEKEQNLQEKLELLREKQNDAKSKDDAADKLPKGSAAEQTLRQQAAADREAAAGLKETAEALTAERDALRNAMTQPDVQGLRQRAQQVPRQIRDNRLGEAEAGLQAMAEQLEQLVDSLARKAEPETRNADELRKKRKAADARLDKLVGEQELLQKKIEAAKQVADPRQRSEELQKLAAEQKKLEQATRDLAGQLERADADAAARELHRAARQMEEDAQQLQQGEAPATPEDSLQRLDDAQEQLDKQRDRSEEELLREQLAKAADLIRALRDRQQGAVEEEKRLHAKVMMENGWKLSAAKESLPALVDQQAGLGKEVRALIGKRFESAPVFARMLRQSAQAMETAVKRLEQRKEDVLDQLEGITAYSSELEEVADRNIRVAQETALKRLDQLLEALKPDQEILKPQPKKSDGTPPMTGPAGGKPSDALPPLAQLRALRALQADLAQRTAEFDKAHPDRSKLTREEADDLDALQKAQLDIAELVQELTPASTMGK